MNSLWEIRTALAVVVDQLYAEATLEWDEARWPARRGEPVPVSGGDEADPTHTAAWRPDRTNQDRADQIIRALKKALYQLEDERDRPAKRRKRLRRCGHCGDTPATRRSPFDSSVWLCAKDYQWEWDNKQRRTA